MSFFESIPPPPPPEWVPPETPAWMRPDEIVPGAVSGEMVIAQTRQRLGILYADGRRAATTGRPWPDDDVADEKLILIPDGSGGDDHRWDGDFWVHPLPPDGPVTFVVSWPRFDVAETRVKFDGAAIREGAGRAVSLWPEEPEL